MTRKQTKNSIDRPAVYRSSIPKNATEVVVKHYLSGTKQLSDYYLNGQTVGSRYWDMDGQLEFEWALGANGARQGYEYKFTPNGQMTFKSRYVDGREHGTARQWNDQGQLLITYTMRHGVGLDLWCDNITGKLSEERYHCDAGELGYERWWNNERTIHREAYWLYGCGWHGIERQWNQTGRLSRGFPKYYVRDQRVTKRQYIRACDADPTLPKFLAAENRPYRKLPQSYVVQRERLRRLRRLV